MVYASEYIKYKAPPHMSEEGLVIAIIFKENGVYFI
jgi:hypothetical protein